MRMLKLCSTRAAQPLHSRLVEAGSTKTTLLRAHSALHESLVRNCAQPGSGMDVAR